MKKGLAIVLGTLVILAAVYILVPGFLKNGSAYIGEYTVAEDGRSITFEVGVGSSIGFIRRAAVQSRENGRLCIDCYSAFGGLNGSLGAQSCYTLPLDADTEIIAIYRSDGSYQDVLQKNAEGVWERI